MPSSFLLPDVNVLVYAHRQEGEEQVRVADWLKARVDGDGITLFTPQTISGFLRVVTHPRVFVAPSPLDHAIAFLDGLLSRRNSIVVESGPRYWSVMAGLLTKGDARGDLVPDAALAATAIECGAMLATRDRDFARFDDLDWVDPLRAA